jgi:hypothetical protein
MPGMPKRWVLGLLGDGPARVTRLPYYTDAHEKNPLTAIHHISWFTIY